MKKLWILAAALLAAQSAAADGIFSPMDASRVSDGARATDPTYRALADSPATAQIQVVEANAAAIDARAGMLTFNVGQGLELKAYQIGSKQNDSGTFFWAGVIEDLGASAPFSADTLQFDPMNRVNLIRNGELITANIHFRGEWYKVRPLKSGGHAIVRVDYAGMPPEHPREYAQLPHYAMPENGPIRVNTTIRILVNYTPSAAAAVADINGLIDLAVAETNQGYAQSGVQIDMVLANKSLTQYTQSNSFSTDLSRYRGTTDKYMKEIHTTRDNNAADVALLVINNASSCGLASGIGSTATTAFAAAHWDCITGYYSFGHEVGHLQSARHDPENDPTSTPYAYGHGYQYEGSSLWRTIMAYNCSPTSCPRLNYWSNPNNTYGGVPMGTAALNDNARVLNNTRATIAAFR